MQKRHQDRQQYFHEQQKVTEEYVIPYLRTHVIMTNQTTVAEIGCGEAGNLLPFLNMGCKVVGIDISTSRIENAKLFFTNHPLKKNLTLIDNNIYNVSNEQIGQFDLIMLRDTIEHIPNQAGFLKHLATFLNPTGKVFFGFPPWRMPFGGHQQVCKSPLLCKLPYFHLLPKPLYKFMLKTFGEMNSTVLALMEVRETKLSIASFQAMIRKSELTIIKETLYLINPNYDIKFGLRPQVLPAFLNIPFFKDFFTTAYYGIAMRKDAPV